MYAMVQHDLTEEYIDLTVTPMDDIQVQSVRQYYLSIIGDKRLTYSQKKKCIFDDLVQPLIDSRRRNNNKNDEDNSSNMVSSTGTHRLSYQCDLNSGSIKSLHWLQQSNVVCVGRNPECDIYCSDNTVSRIHLFIFKINDKIMVLDSWSANGTKVQYSQSNKTDNNNDNNNCNSNESKINENSKLGCKSQMNDHDIDDKKKLGEKTSTSKRRAHGQILVFGAQHTVHLKIARKIDLVLNPKECIICLNKARTIRTKECGHYLMCTTCFNNYCKDQEKENIRCPLCRTEISGNIDDIIISSATMSGT